MIKKKIDKRTLRSHSKIKNTDQNIQLTHTLYAEISVNISHVYGYAFLILCAGKAQVEGQKCAKSA